MRRGKRRNQVSMKLFKKILLAALVVFIIIQFIQPGRNTSKQVLLTDITNIYTVPDSVQHVLEIACYDCHSDNTKYPFYVHVQPIAWFMANHIKNGKADLNFSEFGIYSVRKQQSKLTAIINSIHDDDMPLSSYKLMHKSANLTQDEKALIIGWATEIKDSLSAVN